MRPALIYIPLLFTLTCCDYIIEKKAERANSILAELKAKHKLIQNSPKDAKFGFLKFCVNESRASAIHKLKPLYSDHLIGLDPMDGCYILRYPSKCYYFPELPNSPVQTPNYIDIAWVGDELFPGNNSVIREPVDIMGGVPIKTKIHLWLYNNSIYKISTYNRFENTNPSHTEKYNITNYEYLYNIYYAKYGEPEWKNVNKGDEPSNYGCAWVKDNIMIEIDGSSATYTNLYYEYLKEKEDAISDSIARIASHIDYQNDSIMKLNQQSENI